VSPFVEFVIVAGIVVFIIILAGVGAFKTLPRGGPSRQEVRSRDLLILDIEQLADEYREIDSVLASRIRERIAEFKRKELGK